MNQSPCVSSNTELLNIFGMCLKLFCFRSHCVCMFVPIALCTNYCACHKNHLSQPQPPIQTITRKTAKSILGLLIFWTLCQWENRFGWVWQSTSGSVWVDSWTLGIYQFSKTPNKWKDGCRNISHGLGKEDTFDLGMVISTLLPLAFSRRTSSNVHNHLVHTTSRGCRLNICMWSITCLKHIQQGLQVQVYT